MSQDTQDSGILYAGQLAACPEDLDLSPDRFFADMPSFSSAGDGGVGTSSGIFTGAGYDASSFFASCVTDFEMSLDEDDDEPFTEQPLQQDAPARQDPPVDLVVPPQQVPPAVPAQEVPPQQAAAAVPPQPAAAVEQARFCAATSITEDIISGRIQSRTLGLRTS